jgi:hypothetical protein
MRLPALKYVLITALLCPLAAAAQTLHQPVAVPQPTGSYIVFKFDWNQGMPWLRYTLTVDDAGNTHFDGVGSPSENGENDSFTQDFRMSDANRQKIFDLARKADYFRGTLEAKQKNIAKTGEKTLEYHGKSEDGALAPARSATYNFSTNNDVQELTRIFQAVAATLDFGRKLAYQYKFDKLGMDARLQSLKDLQASHYVEELQAIEPILQKIAGDPNMMHINRVTAKQLLNSVGLSPSGSQLVSQP